jgi:DNA-binding beta-propeller fold protein YncE
MRFAAGAAVVLAAALAAGEAPAAAAAAATYEAPLDARGPGSVKLVAGPKVAADGEGIRISFQVSAAADVEVAVLDAEGGVVRHLAAGLLGRNAPAPFRKDSLSQAITWDRRDDRGRPVLSERSESKGPFKVRVRVGSAPRLEKHLGWNGNNLHAAKIAGLAVGEGGEVYVLLSDGTWGRSELRVLDKNGKYLRTIMPYPANTPEERLEGVGRLEVDGERLPVVFNGHCGSLSPLTAGMKKQNMCFSPKGHLLAASAVGTITSHGPPRHLLAFHPEGGAPEGTGFVGPQIRGAKGFLGGPGEGYTSTTAFDHLATSPDGDFIYLTTSIASSYGQRERQHGVFRLKWGEEELGQPFLGKKEAGADDSHFNDPQGLAVDAKGNLYVCDRGNNRVVVFDAAGKLLGKFGVETPQQLAVHPGTGEIYVVCRGTRKRGRVAADANETRLVKYSAWGQGQPRELARLDQGKRTLELMALDPGASPPKLWVVLNMGYGKSNQLLPLFDRGGKLEAGKSVHDPRGLSYPKYLAADPRRGRVLFARHYDRRGGSLGAIEVATGKVSRLSGIASTDVALDREGNIYVMQGRADKGSVARYDPAGKPLPFPGTGSHELKLGYYRPNGYSGLCVGFDGSVYVFRVNNANYGGVNDFDGVEGCVDVYGPDGKLRKQGLVDGLGHGDCGLGVDAAGNIYVGANIKPEDKPFPEPFAGKIPRKGWAYWGRGKGNGKREAPWCYPYHHPYLFHWGSIFKFGPAGGEVFGLAYNVSEMKPPPRKTAKIPPPSPLVFTKNAPAGAAAYSAGYLGVEVKVAGAKWRYMGFGPVPMSVGEGAPRGDPACSCQTGHFAVDPYGRIYAPNPFRFSVEMLDAGGNQIARIGRYGNADSAGPGSRLPEPEIAFAWPRFVSAAGDGIYVSDAANRRITVVRLDYADAAECAVP